jgi:hypothetical protein
LNPSSAAALSGGFLEPSFAPGAPRLFVFGFRDLSLEEDDQQNDDQ